MKRTDVVVIEQQEHLFAWLGEKITEGGGTAALPPYLATRFKDILDQLGISGWWIYKGSHGQYLQELLAEVVEAGIPPSTEIHQTVLGFVFETLRWDGERRDTRIIAHYLAPLTWLLDLLPSGEWRIDHDETDGTNRIYSQPAAEREFNVRVDVVLRETPRNGAALN